MRVFKIGLGVLALMLGLAGSVRAESMPDKDIVDTAASAGSFKTLVAAVQAAGLVDALKGQGPLTVFAPTDEAFNKLPAGTVENLLKPENKDKLIAVLTYHVVPGRVTAGEVANLASAKFSQRNDRLVARVSQHLVNRNEGCFRQSGLFGEECRKVCEAEHVAQQNPQELRLVIDAKQIE